MKDAYFDTFIKILKKELVLAMGCTEPIAIAYASAVAKSYLEETPVKAVISASGNIIKNVKSVTVPHTNGLRGIEVASAVGIFYGDPNGELNCLSNVTEKQAISVKERLKEIEFCVKPLKSEHVLDLIVELSSEHHHCKVRIANEHTNIVSIIRDDKIILDEPIVEKTTEENLDYSELTIERIYKFANEVDLEEVRDTIARQISCNMAISNRGLESPYGAQIGRVLLKQSDNVRTIAKAKAASGSDARMNGCELPVVICSGSGNQGLTVSIPVIVYAMHYQKSKEELYRALLVSNLVTLHLKSGIGRLSAYCGAISAGAGAGSGIAYLLTRDLEAINHTIVNTLAVSSGVICDGAKASCAAKIALAVDTGILGFEMYQNGMEFYGGDGIVTKGVENTIKNISILGHDGMKETDQTIIDIMTKE